MPFKNYPPAQESPFPVMKKLNAIMKATIFFATAIAFHAHLFAQEVNVDSLLESVNTRSRMTFRKSSFCMESPSPMCTDHLSVKWKSVRVSGDSLHIQGKVVLPDSELALSGIGILMGQRQKDCIIHVLDMGETPGDLEEEKRNSLFDIHIKAKRSDRLYFYLSSFYTLEYKVGELVELLQAQAVGDSGYTKNLKKIKNEKVDYFVSNPVRIRDSAGEVVALRNIVVLEDKCLNGIVKKYGKSMVPYLVNLMADSLRDWAANLLLYNITRASAVLLKYYSYEKVNEWRQERKAKDIAKWKEYMREHGL